MGIKSVEVLFGEYQQSGGWGAIKNRACQYSPDNTASMMMEFAEIWTQLWQKQGKLLQSGELS